MCDGSNDATVDTNYLASPEIDLRKMNFGVDAFGRKLRYKVCAFDMKVMAILYDNGSIIERLLYQEISIPAAGSLVSFNDKFFGKILKVPNRMCCAFEESDLPC